MLIRELLIVVIRIIRIRRLAFIRRLALYLPKVYQINRTQGDK